MSRGMGSVQQGILHCLANKKAWSARTLGQHILNSTSPAALVSIRRAARALEATGLIITVPDISTSKFWQLAAANKRHQAKKKAKEHKRADERRQEEERARRRAMDEKYEPPKRSSNSKLATLAKILGMLGSGADGEALAAARRAEKLRRQMDVTWDKLLRVD
jgi:ABC-type branched-subunit amino acid transport system substrate-binding protein